LRFEQQAGWYRGKSLSSLNRERGFFIPFFILSKVFWRGG
jgi:hypothetical protein